MRDSSDIWTGKANSYDRARPGPSTVLLDLSTQLIGMSSRPGGRFRERDRTVHRDLGETG